MPIDIDAARKALEEKQDDLVRESELGAQARETVGLDQQSVGRLSRMDALQGQAMANAAERRRAVDLARIDAALRRIDDDEYGYCLDCGEKIAPRRLELDPAATHCIGCASSAETR